MKEDKKEGGRGDRGVMEGKGEAEERRREAPKATLSQQRLQRLTVRQTDRMPPKVTNTFIYQTHTGAMEGCALSVPTGHRKHSVGRVTD